MAHPFFCSLNQTDGHTDFGAVPTWGYLFEAFICMHGSYSSRKRHKQLLIEADESKKRQYIEHIVATERVSFYFHTLAALKSRGKLVNNQLFFIASALRFRGTSMSGLTMLWKMNVGLSDRTFRRMWSARVAEVKSLIE